MSELIIIRHGQGSFMTGNYDQLSALGEEQAHRLGACWAGLGLRVDRLVIGPRKRHQQTAEAMLGPVNAADLVPGEILHDDRLDEFDWDGLFRYANSTLSRRDPEVDALRRAFEEAPDLLGKRRTIQHYMERVMALWAQGAFFEEGLETWDAFRSRVAAAVRQHMADLPKGSRVALVTSGGVAAAWTGHILGLDAPRTQDLIWTLRNGALVEFLFGGGRISLSAFNSAPHLDERRLWTYR